MDILILIVVLLLVFGYPAHRWGYSRGYSYGPIGVIVVIIVVLLLFRFIR